MNAIKRINNLLLISLALLLSIHPTFATNTAQRNCVILLDNDDTDNVGVVRWFLISRVQSLVAEQSTPFLININLWNSFVERKINFAQDLEKQDTPVYKIYQVYQTINERIAYWSNHYNAISNDAIQNKKLVVQQINNEFYHDKETVSSANYQLLLNYYTPFNAQDWDIYKHGGYYLFIPKKYSAQYPLTGFKIDSLECVVNPEDSPNNYFESHTKKSITDVLSNFFLTHDDFADKEIPYTWNIHVAGHGGAKYIETHENGAITWSGEPVISDLTLQELSNMLTFFHSQVKTNLFHYTSCYAGGNHIILLFQNNHNQPYNFTIICDTLTDCASYCKWTIVLPSYEKKFLTTNDIIYDSDKQCWQLPLTPVYYWGDFFNAIQPIDFSVGSIEQLPEILSLISYPIIANIPLICLPNTNTFFPVQSTDTIKIDEQLLNCIEEKDNSITLHAIKTVLVESTVITPTIMLNHYNPLRIISIKPGNALHYIKKLEATNHLDIPSVFWQAQYQRYNKTFILDECIFPYSYDFKDILPQKGKLTLKNVIISQQKDQYMRIFFTFNDQAMMVIAHKPGQNEESDKATIQEVVTLTASAQQKYEEYYVSLKNAALKALQEDHN